MNGHKQFYRLSLLILFLNIAVNANAQADKTLYQGAFEADSYFTTFEGSWKIVQNDEQLYVVLGNDFKAKKAPDLQIFLSKLVLDDINGKNAASKGAPLLVAKLDTFKGNARYKIPGNPDLSLYRSIIIHCVEYSKLWGGANLK
ncbi:DM13 domain-containing protein [Fulvivirgaceae bacterium BMA12]|uniref:DM13 domain-containing protein n=1 Tax=Agaribacillus aureus TaxID=3051825 RepID=A0ABT8L092_9BACT|nr:DM13 domain-containing protein [Fulvivirgaceae bacterium BMA12]